LFSFLSALGLVGFVSRQWSLPPVLSLPSELPQLIGVPNDGGIEAAVHGGVDQYRLRHLLMPWGFHLWVRQRYVNFSLAAELVFEQLG
jgi:hypothetical protein